jgi:uncharacterized SAM-binding protein YcdF (DUF218 family)
MLSKLVIAAISPLGTALLAGCIAILLALLHRKRLALCSAVFAVSWLWLWSMPLVSDAAIAHIEKRYQPIPLQDVPEASAIVILGGGVGGTRWPLEIGQPADLGKSADRVWHGARLYHAGKAPMVILAGAQYFGDGMTEAEAMELFLLDLGVPPAAIVLEQRSRTTQENARYTAQLLDNIGKNDILLVTSATHMARAVSHFEALGLAVVPTATDYKSAGLKSRYCCLPDADALNDSRTVFKELLGQLVLH